MHYSVVFLSFLEMNVIKMQFNFKTQLWPRSGRKPHRRSHEPRKHLGARGQETTEAVEEAGR